MKEVILKKLSPNQIKRWGATLNLIQDIAIGNLPTKSVKRYVERASDDAGKCEGMDCILLNGRVFDWREFSRRGEEIISAYLDYFNEDELRIINSKL